MGNKSLFQKTLSHEQFDPIPADQQKKHARTMKSARQEIKRQYDGDDFESVFDQIKQSNGTVSSVIRSTDGFTDDDQSLIQEQLTTYRDARDRLVLSCIRLVFKYYYDHRKEIPVERDEFVSEALVYMVEATEQYDPDRSTKFSTFLKYYFLRTKQKLKETFRSSVHTPRYLIEAERQYYRALESLQKKEQPMNRENLQRESGLEWSTIKRIELIPGIVSIVPHDTNRDSPHQSEHRLPDDRNRSRPDDVLNQQMLQDHLRSFMNDLDDQETIIFREYFFKESVTLQELADRFDYSRERIRQIKDNLKERLADSDYAPDLRSILHSYKQHQAG